MKIGIIGKGNVSTTLAVNLLRGGHEIRHGLRDPREPVAEAAR
jgi:predicted dinucleotide-binding enzyme